MNATSVAIEHTIIGVFAVICHLTSDRSCRLPSIFWVWPLSPSDPLPLGVKVLPGVKFLPSDERTLALPAKFCAKAHALSGIRRS
jgi:hypothetical protein